eukprot:Gb_19871 [translate_table: standard]
MLCLFSVWEQTRAWCRDYDKVQTLAVILLYVQIACALIGSLGAIYTGVLLINLAVALFAIIAIESSSQSLGRTYAVLLGFALALDIAWFIFFSSEIWNIDPLKFGKFSSFSVKIVFWMQTTGFSVRFISSFVWFRMYRLGASSDNNSVYQPADFESRIGLLNPSSPAPARQTSIGTEVLGGSIYDPAYYSSLFQDTQDLGHSYEVDKQIIGSNGATTSPCFGSP